MNSKAFGPLFAIGLITATIVADGGSRAADIDDLRLDYDGSSHSTSSSLAEDEFLGLDVTNKWDNGKFTGVFGIVPVTGKVTSTGKITFSGQISEGNSFLRIKNGKGQLSATGLFIVGSYKIQSNAPEITTGSFIFELEED